VTGASRGIGRASARHLAAAGFDVALTARTLSDGERREHSSTVHASNSDPLPGSLDAAAAEIRDAGSRSLCVTADLLDRTSLERAVTTVLEEWGHIDVLVQNGRYIGPGHMDTLLDTPIDLLDAHLQANVVAPLLLLKLVLPGMIERGGGRIIDITSHAAYGDPPAAAGRGGWGMGYGVSKGAFHRIAGVVAAEHADDGIVCVNLQPGLTRTERIVAEMGQFGFGDGAPLDVIASVVAWFAVEPDITAYNGRTVEAQYFCYERGLVPEWPGPWLAVSTITERYDLAGARLQEMESRRRAALGG
jgi:NAD(P)-dependent dehydrogenase (short-subunit alcohol dehydrogenase family)